MKGAISVTQAPKVNVVWVSKQAVPRLPRSAGAEGLKGTVTPPKAIKGNCSVHTSDKLFVALAAQKRRTLICDCLWSPNKVRSLQRLTVFPPTPLHLYAAASVSFADTTPCRSSRPLSFIICTSDCAWDKPDSLKSLSPPPSSPAPAGGFARQRWDLQYFDEAKV